MLLRLLRHTVRSSLRVRLLLLLLLWVRAVRWLDGSWLLLLLMLLLLHLSVLHQRLSVPFGHLVRSFHRL